MNEQMNELTNERLQQLASKDKLLLGSRAS